MGDSTIAANYPPGIGIVSVPSLVLNSSEMSSGYAIDTIAVPGDTIDGQLTLWNALPDKTIYDYVICQIGLNDIDPTETAAIALARYQNMIDGIRSDINAGAKILVSCMLPCKQRLIDVYGATDGVTAHTKWADMNDAIMGIGPNAITGVDGRIDDHVALLDDGSGNLDSAYDTGDHVHENNAGRDIIAESWRNGLISLNLLNP